MYFYSVGRPYLHDQSLLSLSKWGYLHNYYGSKNRTGEIIIIFVMCITSILYTGMHTSIYSIDLSDFAIFAVLLIHRSEHTGKLWLSPVLSGWTKAQHSTSKSASCVYEACLPSSQTTHTHQSLFWTPRLPVLMTNAGSQDVSHPGVSPSEPVSHGRRPFLRARFEKQSRCPAVAPPFQTTDETAVQTGVEPILSIAPQATVD